MPAGFRAGGATAGIKPSGRPDVAVIVAHEEAAAAAVFTTNALRAAPVRLSERHLAAREPAGRGRYGSARAVIATSGCANAATGPEGDRDQERLAEALGSALGVPPQMTLALSTGLIGTRLPLARVTPAVTALVRDGLSDRDEGLEAAAEALLTTDTHRKVATASLELPDAEGGAATVRVTGIAKGVGMIHPRMATMLAVVLTDAVAAPELLHGILRRATTVSWNQLTVDGDTSTNDTVFLLASGRAGRRTVAPGSEAAAALGGAVESVARSLARQQAADGEGASTLITCQVTGAADDAEARAVARSVVASSLVKAAVHGRDPNWGRVAAAAGNARLPERELLEGAVERLPGAATRAASRVSLDPDRLRIAIAGVLVFAGRPIPFDEPAVRGAMAAAELTIRLDLGLGAGFGEAFGCDLTERYVIENSSYTT